MWVEKIEVLIPCTERRKGSSPPKRPQGGPPRKRLGGEVAFLGSMPTLYVHADESGTLDFGPKGTRFYTFAAAWTLNPQPLAQRLTDLRFDFLKRGVDVSRFHAQPDSKQTRRRVLQAMTEAEDWSFCATVVDKSKVYKSLRDQIRFYPKFLGYCLNFVLRGNVPAEVDHVMVFTDRLPSSRRTQAIEKAIKSSCRTEIRSDVTFQVYHHPADSNCWLQVADYCCWAVHRRHEHGDSSYYDQVRSHLAAEELFLWPDP